MKILLTNSPFQYYMTTAFFHPDWIAHNLPQLAAMVRPRHEVRIVDNWHFYVRQEGVQREIGRFRPDILGVSNSTAADTNRVLGLARKVRQEHPRLFMAVGGQAAAVRYRECLDAGFDAVVIGEGEYTFRDLVERVAEGGRDFADIPGVAYRAGERYVLTPPRGMVESLDDLPFPSWELMPRVRSRFFRGMRASVIETSRGCPFQCDFCSIQSYWERSYRKKSNDRIIEELKYLKFKLGFEQVYFIDDSFALNVREYTELFERMIREGVTVKGFSQIRPDTVANNPEMMRLAARAGFWGFLVGFDSYNEEELRSVRKSGGADVNARAAAVLRENGIGIFGVHMFGMPGSDPASFKRTFERGMANSDTFRMSRFSLIPGTPLFERSMAEKRVEARVGQYVPYSHKFKMRPEEERRMNRMYVWYEARSLLGLTALRFLFASRGIARKLKLRAYLVAFRYCLYLFFRKIGRPIL